MFMTKPVAFNKLSPYYQYMENRFRADGAEVGASVPDSYAHCTNPNCNKACRPFLSGHHSISHYVRAGTEAFDIMDHGSLASCQDRIDMYIWDNETYSASSFKPNLDHALTIEQFAQWSGRNADKLNPDSIKANCWEEFLTFRHWQYGQIVRNFERWVHSHNPAIRVGGVFGIVSAGHNIHRLSIMAGCQCGVPAHAVL